MEPVIPHMPGQQVQTGEPGLPRSLDINLNSMAEIDIS